MKKNEPARIEWVSVYSANWEAEAEVVRCRLEAENLPVVCQKGSTGWVAIGLFGGRSAMDGPMGQFDVLVPENRAEEAKKILNTQVEITDFGAE